MAAMTIATMDKPVLKAPADPSGFGAAVVVVMLRSGLPGAWTTATETLVTWTALMADAGAPAFVRAVLKTSVNCVLNVVSSVDAEAALAVTASAFSAGA